MEKLKRYFFPSLIAISALSVSGSAAFYSVTGLSKLFAGASFAVIIMAGSLEFAKLVTASLLYRYWKDMNKLLKGYLTVATIVLVLITSMGIYGFLSAAYQDTFRQLTIKNNEVGFLEQKKNFYDKDVIRYDKELERISNNISTLSNARSQSIQIRDTSVAGGVRTTISTSELRMAAKRIEVEESNRKSIQAKREIVADSLQKYQLAILDLENNVDVAGELGPLEYLSGLTGIPMDKIINYLLLVIIFVFDPLAISLVIAANYALEKAAPKRNLYQEVIDDDPWNDQTTEEHPINEEVEDLSPRDISKILKENENPSPPNESLKDAWEESERRMNIIGQNGNDGEHYEDIKATPEPPEDWEVVDNGPSPERILMKGPSVHKVLFDDGSIKKVNKDDDIIRYL